METSPGNSPAWNRVDYRDQNLNVGLNEDLGSAVYGIQMKAWIDQQVDNRIMAMQAERPFDLMGSRLIAVEDSSASRYLEVDMSTLKNSQARLVTVATDISDELALLKLQVDTESATVKRLASLCEELRLGCGQNDTLTDHHASLQQRVDYLEKLLGESADKHGLHKTTVETRLEYIEGLLGDSAEKHSNEIGIANEKLADLHAALESCAKVEHHSSMEQRMEYLEKFLGESADKHEKDLAAHKDAGNEHATSMESRLAYVEALLGDSSDKHANEIKAANEKLADFHAVLESCAKAEHHASLEERMEYLEKAFGDSADKHELLAQGQQDMVQGQKDMADQHEKDLAAHKAAGSEHATSMETRLAYVEALLGDSSDKHANEINAANEKLADLHAALESCAKAEHHASMEERMEYLEKAFGDSADKHEGLAQGQKDMADHRSSVETRLDYIERLLGDSADRDRDFKQHQKDLADHKASMDARLKGLLGESADKDSALAQRHRDFTDHKTSMETRLEYIERMLGDSADKHGKEIDAAHDKLADLSAAIASCARTEHHATLEERMNFLETLLGESADKHAEHLAALTELREDANANQSLEEREKDFARAEHVETLRQCMSLLENHSNARMQQCEQTISQEIQKLWFAFDGHSHGAVSIIEPHGATAVGNQSSQYTMVQRSSSSPRQASPTMVRQASQTMVQHAPSIAREAMAAYPSVAREVVATSSLGSYPTMARETMATSSLLSLCPIESPRNSPRRMDSASRNPRLAGMFSDGSIQRPWLETTSQLPSQSLTQSPEYM